MGPLGLWGDAQFSSVETMEEVDEPPARPPHKYAATSSTAAGDVWATAIEDPDASPGCAPRLTASHMPRAY